MNDIHAAEIMKSLGELQGMVRSHLKESDKTQGRFDNDINNLWAHTGENRTRIATNTADIANIEREVFRKGIAAGSVSGGVASVILLAIVWVIENVIMKGG